MVWFRHFTAWLGIRRAWALFALLAGTGALSLVLQTVAAETGAPWAIPTQNVLLLIWLDGSVLVIGGRLAPESRRLLIMSVGPLLVSLLLGVFFPDFLPWFLGAGVGWLIVSQVLLRRTVRREYQQAIRHLRRSEYDQAIAIMNTLIKAEPQDSGHYRFRAELHRLQGHPQRALKDYRRVIELEPDAGVGYNGLAEVYLQENNLEEALTFARLAYEREPEHWVTPYNLGMIEERLHHAAAAAQHLQEALQAGVSDSRHRLLIHLWLARSCVRLRQIGDAENALAALRREKSGLQEWLTIFESEQAATLRRVLDRDVELARRIVDGAGVEVFSMDGVPIEADP